MSDLEFKIEHAEPVAFSAAPLLTFKLRINNSQIAEQVQSVMLRCQIQIETTRRSYQKNEQEQLSDLFGVPERWSQTLRPMLWTHASIVVPPFKESTLVDLPVPCSFDFNVAATKYFAALADGEVPLNLMFSGTVFYQTLDGSLQAQQIPWDREAKYRLPVEVWRKMMDLYYPNSAWLCVRRDVFDRLKRFKMQQSIPTWEQALELIIPDVRDDGDDLVPVEGSLPS